MTDSTVLYYQHTSFTTILYLVNATNNIKAIFTWSFLSPQKIESPEAYIAKLDEYSELTVPADQYQHHSWLKYTEGLRTALATQSNTFVSQFMDAGGLATLLRFLESMDDSTFQSSIHMNIIACVKALMNNSVCVLCVVFLKVLMSNSVSYQNTCEHLILCVCLPRCSWISWCFCRYVKVLYRYILMDISLCLILFDCTY